MATVVAQADIVQTNSTSYVDLLGVVAGLRRFTGETAAEFRDRVWRAVSVDRGAQYNGLLNELGIQLGLVPQEVIRVWDNTGALNVAVGLGGLSVSNQNGSLTIPLLNVDGDDLWVWKKHSELVTALNASGLCYAELVGEDGPALQLPKQTNVRTARGEVISGTTARLANSTLIPGTELFSMPVPSYTISDNKQLLVFKTPVPDGTTVTYQYRMYPYSIVSSPVGLLSLVDPALASAAVTENNKLVYQMREYIQAVMEQDRSYWGV